MKQITNKVLLRFFKEASKKLEGEWVLLGGSVLPSLGREIRATVDIDIAGKDFKGSEFQLELMSVAEKIKLPVDAVNTAAEFFLRKIKGYESQLVLLYEERQFRVYRPNVNLFIRLKISRLSESDLMDCEEFLNFADEIGEELDKERLLKIISQEIQKRDSRKERLYALSTKI